MYVLPGGSRINFRPDAVKIIALWTDAEFHKPGDAPDYPGASFTEVIAAINSLGRRRSRDLQDKASPLDLALSGFLLVLIFLILKPSWTLQVLLLLQVVLTAMMMALLISL
jgi:hypothetical protein